VKDSKSNRTDKLAYEFNPTMAYINQSKFVNVNDNGNSNENENNNLNLETDINWDIENEKALDDLMWNHKLNPKLKNNKALCYKQRYNT